MARVDYFYGDGLDASPEELGYDPDSQFQEGEEIDLTDYDKEHGDYKETYRIMEIKLDSDQRVCATVYFIESTLPQDDS